MIIFSSDFNKMVNAITKEYRHLTGHEISSKTLNEIMDVVTRSAAGEAPRNV